MIVGTSAGALNGAYIASRPQSVETADALGEIWRGLRRGQVFPLNPVAGLLGFLGTRDHLVPSSGLHRLIRRNVECERLEDMPVTLHVIAVDFVSGEELRLSSGQTVDAVLASASIPAVLPPVSWNGRELMDGGVANNSPISHAERHGGEAKLIVLPPPCPLAIPPIDFDHADILIQRSYSDAGEFLDGGGSERPPIRMRMHRHTSTGQTRKDPVAAK